METQTRSDTKRVKDLRQRVRIAMEHPPVEWDCPARIADKHMSKPLPVRKALAIALKLKYMPADLWEGQLFAGSMTLEKPRIHAEKGFPDYTTKAEREEAQKHGLDIRSIFGHIVPDYPKLLAKGLNGIKKEAETQYKHIQNPEEKAFLDSVIIAVEAVMDYADRLANNCRTEADKQTNIKRKSELKQIARNLQQVPSGPAKTFWQALQSVWLLHMIFHSTMNGNALGRLDQYIWPYLKTDLRTEYIDLDKAVELVNCFCLKFNERAKTTEDQTPLGREKKPIDLTHRTRHYTSSQLGTNRDRVDATNHWLQNIVISGLTPEGTDGTNPLSYLLLESYRRNQMTNPLLTVRLHDKSPDKLIFYVCNVLKEGGGMPAIFNDETLIPALKKLGIPEIDAVDYTNDGCWEVIIPGRTDFRFQRLSLMLCLEWALNHGRSLLDNTQQGPDTGDPEKFNSFDDVWKAFLIQMNAMVKRVVNQVVETIDDRHTIAPVPLLSALIDGAITSRRDMTAGGAKFRTFGMLAESAAYVIDSLAAIKTVIFKDKQANISELCDALKNNFESHSLLRTKLLDAPKYGNDNEETDSIGQKVINAFTKTVKQYAKSHRALIKFPAGVATFSWYIGIGEGLGASPDGRLANEPVSSNFSPALGRDLYGIPNAILSYSKMLHNNLPAGGPVDLRIARRLVKGDEGIARMAGLIRSLIDLKGSMMTLTVADTEELRAAQQEPEKYKSLRVRMGGWSAYFTMLSHEQQEHHIRRQEARS